MKKLAVLLLSLMFFITTKAQNFYDLTTIQTIEITFTQSNWDAILDAENAGADGYVMAQSVSINGTVYDSVGVKYKGNSSYNANQAKNPFHIELDTYKDHIHEGYTDIKLSNVAKDPSFLREVLSYQILRQYMDAPLSNYANVYVNGTLIGLYTSSEAITKKFAQKYFYSKDNAFFKCNPPAGAGPGTTDLPNLKYLGQDSSLYYAAYEMKSDAGWKELINLCDTLANNTAAIEKILDVDRALWMLAFDNVLVNLDSYIAGFAQNYYLYRDDNNRFVPIVWDLNESFGQFSAGLNSTAAKQQMDNLMNAGSANYPLLSKLLSVPMYKRMYLAHCKTIILENFDNNNYYSMAQTLQTMIDGDVQADGNKFYSYANFLSNINSDVTTGGGPGGGTTPGITNLMGARSTYLLGLSNYTATQPTISNISVSNASPNLNETITITADVIDENTVYLGFRNAITQNFTRVQMFDDGAHNDGTAGDGKYGADLTITSSQMDYYIYAENGTIGKFSPVRAEHEYYQIIVPATINELVINEFMASNSSTYADGQGNYSDWVEIYNTTNAAIDLSDYYLTDNISNPTKFHLPAVNIPAYGYKIIWADGDTLLGDDHAGFKLSASGEELGLFYDNGSDTVSIDELIFGAQTTDISYGREYDAAPTWIYFTIPTPNAMNQILVSLNEENEIIGLNVNPNPYQNNITIENPSGSMVNITIYSATGQILDKIEVNSNESIQWIDNFDSGLRLLHIASNGDVEVIRMVKY